MSSLTAQTTIYDHTFDGGTGDLAGTAEDFSGTIWSNATADPGPVSSNFNANGTSSNATGVWLPVAIETGKEYVLTLGSVQGFNWFAAGFAEKNGDSAFNQNGANGYASILVNSQSASAFLGVKTGNTLFNNLNLNTELDTGTSNTVWDIQITLDTTTPLWSVDYAARVAGDAGAFTSIASGAYTVNPTINYVGISANGTGANDVDTFSLTVIPEPGTYALLAGCFGLSFVMLRRRRG